MKASDKMRMEEAGREARQRGCLRTPGVDPAWAQKHPRLAAQMTAAWQRGWDAEDANWTVRVCPGATGAAPLPPEGE